MQEVWEPFPGHPNYSISNLGRVFNEDHGRERTIVFGSSGWGHVTLYSKGKNVTYYVHRIVAQVFVEGYRDGLIVDFIDGDKTNIRVDNLKFRESTRLKAQRIRETQPRMHGRRVRIVELDMVFRTVEAAADYIGADCTTIYKCLRGERHRHMGYTYEYQNARESLDFLRSIS